MRVLYPSNFGKLTSIFRAHTNAYPLLACVIDCASLKAVFLVVHFDDFYDENLYRLDRIRSWGLRTRFHVSLDIRG